MTPSDRLPPTTPAHRLAIARAALAWERLWRALWPASGLVGLFLILALCDVLPLLPGALHAGVLILFAGGVAYALWRGFRGFALPSRLEARRRLETASKLAHRPLTALDDRVATGAADEATLAIWRAHQRRAADSLKRLRAGAPAPGLARLDPLALRAALAIVLMVAAILSWRDADERLARAVAPALAPSATTAVAVELWITPPKYTGRAPIYLRPGKDDRAEVAVPAGSTLLAQVTGGRGTPTLRLGQRDVAFGDTGDQAFQATAALGDATRIVVRQRGRELGQWTLQPIPDAAPTVAFAKPPAPTQRQSLRLDYEAKDDYGVESLQLIIRRVDGGGAKGTAAPADAPLIIDLSQAGAVQKTVRGTRFQDLTAHPWAGLPVAMQLVAKDALGQTARSDEIKLVLPERQFKHPVAKALVEARKDLMRDPAANREVVAETVGTLALRPDRYNDDMVAFMAMRMAHARLYMDRSPEAIASVAGLLWDTALRIEDGKLSVAERDLRSAQQALQEALNRNAPDAEIEKLIDELQRALQRFMQEMAQDMQNHPERYARQPTDPNATVLDQQDLQRMIERLRDMARTGARDAAREMLSQLRNMLENLRGMAQRPGQMQRGNNPASQAMRDMQGLIQRQQQLMNRTFRDQQRMESGDQSVEGEMQGRAMEQEALRRMLGETMRRLGDMTGQIPDGLGRAERSMRDATDQLQRQSPGRAVGPQGKAIEEMRQGMRQAMQELGRQFGMDTGEPDPNQLGERPDPSQDPLGRPIEGMGNANTSDVKIPEEADVQRAREILDELRRRSSDPGRPQIERDYIDRLLKRF